MAVPSYVDMAKVGVNYSDHIFKDMSRKKGCKIVYNDDVAIANKIDYEQYVIACADNIGAHNIIAAGRMPGGIVVFVKDVGIVTKLSSVGLFVNNIYHNVEPLIKPTVSITISNCPPYIDNDLLIPLIEKHGRIIGTIKPIGAQFKREDLKHICSFRRRVSILPIDKDIDINVREVVFSSGTAHSIFLSNGGMTCFRCKLKGHKAANCSNVVIENVKKNEKQALSRKTDNVNLIKNSKIVVAGVRTPTAENSDVDGVPQAVNVGASTSGATNHEQCDPEPELDTDPMSDADVTNVIIKDIKSMNIDANTDIVEVDTPIVNPATSTPTGHDLVGDNTESLRPVDRADNEDMNNDDNTVNTLIGNDTKLDVSDNMDFDIDDDVMSICSNMSHISELSVLNSSMELSQHQGISLTPPSLKETLVFFHELKNSKRQLQECISFHPDLSHVHNLLFKIKDNESLNKNEKVRIRTLMKKIKLFVRRDRKSKSFTQH